MSSLWTPGGEHPVEPESNERAQEPFNDFADTDLSPEDQERAKALAHEMAAVQKQLAETPAEVVISNHLMGFFELGAIHLSQEPPNLESASVAIDAMGSVVERLKGRLGEGEATLLDALNQIRLAYVAARKNTHNSSNEPTTPDVEGNGP